jgi:dTDP-4-dehydrorhamnose reductase
VSHKIVQKTKILITGSNGLLGQKLVSLLVQQSDIQLIATSGGVNRMDFTNGYEYQEMDITNAEQVSEVIEKYAPMPSFTLPP